MQIVPRFSLTLPHWLVPVAVLLFSVLSIVAVASTVWAAEHDTLQTGERLITIHDRNVEKSLITDKTTLREIFKEAKIATDPNDIVEPGLDEELPGNNYQVNVYRARPITVVDGERRIPIMSAYQTPKDIVEHAGLVLHDEDEASMQPSRDVVGMGMGLELTIDRATRLKLVLYGDESIVYTQTKTVAEFLEEKDITLAKKDTISKKPETAITQNMKLEIWRNGKQTVTKTESIKFGERYIQDADRKVGYREVKTPGVNGKKKVTYEIVMRNGKEVKRKTIQTVVITKPKEQVVVVGSKPSFDGDFADALAKLRSCEGGYDSWNPAGPYYGAYQFNEGTWYGVTDAPYGKATPAEQDAAARTLYERRGWQPWPHCGASLPDIYR